MSKSKRNPPRDLSDEETLLASYARDVDQAKLEPGCQPDDLVAWSEKHQLFTRFPLSNAASAAITDEIHDALHNMPAAAGDQFIFFSSIFLSSSAPSHHGVIMPPLVLHLLDYSLPPGAR